MHDSTFSRVALEEPRSAVPVFYIHSFEQPFCDNEQCPCHRNREQMRQVCIAIVEGKLLVADAAAFAERTV